MSRHTTHTHTPMHALSLTVPRSVQISVHISKQTNIYIYTYATIIYSISLIKAIYVDG